MADDDDPATTVGAESKWRVVRALAHVFRKIDDVVATIGRPLRSFGKESPLREVPHFNPFIYSFEAFIPLLKFDQTANWTLQRDAKGLLWFYWYVHILSGWVLTSLWIGAYAGIMKT